MTFLFETVLFPPGNRGFVGFFRKEYTPELHVEVDNRSNLEGSPPRIVLREKITGNASDSRSDLRSKTVYSHCPTSFRGVKRVPYGSSAHLRHPESRQPFVR